MGLRVRVIAACEVPVVGGDDCVLVPLLDVLPAGQRTGLGVSGLVTWPFCLPLEKGYRKTLKRASTVGLRRQSHREPWGSLRFTGGQRKDGPDCWPGPLPPSGGSVSPAVPGRVRPPWLLPAASLQSGGHSGPLQALPLYFRPNVPVLPEARASSPSQ